MPRVRRAIQVLSLAAVAALFCSPLHAQGKADQSSTPETGKQASLPALIAGGKQPFATSPIWCPDTYRPKCPPLICPPTYCGTCDCYDAKCPPCICPPTYCGTCDCYDAKCPPFLKIPICFPSFYKCPPGLRCGSPLAAKPGIRKPPRK